MRCRQNLVLRPRGTGTAATRNGTRRATPWNGASVGSNAGGSVDLAEFKHQRHLVALSVYKELASIDDVSVARGVESTYAQRLPIL